MHDRKLAPELVEGRGEADVCLSRKIAHRKLGIALAQQVLGGIEYALASLFSPRAGKL